MQPRILIRLFCLATIPLFAYSFSTAQALSSPPFLKTSFDCSKARVLSVEEAICKNEKLAALDLQLADVYRKRLDSAGSEKDGIMASQKKWLVLRNSYRGAPYPSDDLNVIAELVELYKQRIEVLKSSNLALLEPQLPKEYQWLLAIAPAGFSKGFTIVRGYATCADPCQEKHSLYRWISIGGSGTGDPPGDVTSPYDTLVKRLAAEGWMKCRDTTDDSGKLQFSYFRKQGKFVEITRSYSMGVGNSVGLSITISPPLPESSTPVSNPLVQITDDWDSYSDADVGLKVRFPADWHVYGRSGANAPGYKNLIFGADDYKPGDFRITIEPPQLRDPNYVAPDAPKCYASRYRIAGVTATECLFEGEMYGESVCTRYIQSLEIRTKDHELTFEPYQFGSFLDDSGHYKLADLYEKIVSTIELK
jgi:uncharacterized protein YecT (DUF1311 family)